MVSKAKMTRYTLVLPSEMYEEVQKVAAARYTTVASILRRFIKLGLLSIQVEEQYGTALIIRQGNSEKEIVLL